MPYLYAHKNAKHEIIIHPDFSTAIYDKRAGRKRSAMDALSGNLAERGDRSLLPTKAISTLFRQTVAKLPS